MNKIKKLIKKITWRNFWLRVHRNKNRCINSLVLMINSSAIYKKCLIKIDGVRFMMYGDRRKKRDFGLGKEYPLHGNHEPIMSRYFIESLRKHAIKSFWDIGSAYGYYPMLVNTLDPNVEIHIFEIEKKSIKFIRESIKEYGKNKGNFVIINKPVGNKSNEVLLDDYLKEQGYPDLIKMDIQGYETQALKGARKLIQKGKTIFIIETHYCDDYTGRVKLIQNLFNNDQYDFLISTNHRSTTGNIHTLDSLNKLPSKDSTLDQDYMLVCVPKNMERK